MRENPEAVQQKSFEAATTHIVRWKVLLVESDPAEAARIKEWITQEAGWRFDFLHAASLEAALTRLSLGRIHLVLLNLDLADSQGVPTFSRVKSFFPEVPVIVLSAQENEDLARDTTRQGAQSFLVKDRLNAYWLRRAMSNTLERHAADEKLRTAKALYHSLVELLPHGIFRKDTQGRFTFANLRFCQMTGVNPEHLIGKTAAAVFPPDLAERFRAQDHEVLRSGGPYEAIEEFLFADGRRGYVHLIKTPILDRKGRLIGLQGLLMDITERQHAEERLRASQHLLQSIVDNTTLVIYVKDTAGRYLLVNTPFEHLFQVERRDAIGKTDYELFPQEIAEAFWPNDQKVLTDRSPQEFQELITSGGVTRTFASLKFPLCASPGTPYAVCGISTDVTERERAHRALQDSQEQLALVIQGSNDGIWDWNVVTSEVYFSARWKSMLGYAENEIEDNFAAWERLIHPDDLERARKTVRDYFEGRTPTYELEHRLRHKDGSYRWILARGVALRGPDGRPLRMAGSHVDLTERKRLEQRLRAKFDITQALAESASLREAAPRILQAVCDCLEWDYGELWLLDRTTQRLRCFGLWHTQSVELHQFGLASQQAEFPVGVCLPGQVWAEGQPLWIPDTSQPGGVRRFEWFKGIMAAVWVPAARQESAGPRVALARAAGLHGALGFPVQVGEEFVGVMDFFSHEIRQPDEALLQLCAAVGSQFGQFIARTRAEEARGRLAALVESSDDAIFSESLDGLITSWNAGAERMFGYAAAEILGQSADVLAPREKARELEQVRQRIKHSEPVSHLETIRLAKSGKAIYVSLSLSALRDAEGKLAGISTIARDVTERRRAEQRLRAAAARLEQSNRDLLDFAFVASHDLQEPLGKVKAFAELLQQEATDGLTEKGRDYLSRLTKATRRMQDLIDGLLSYSRVHTQAQPFAAVDLDAVLREVLGDLENSIQETGARIETGPLGVIEADPTQMRQLLQNLLSNALKFTRPGVPPVIRLRAERLFETAGSSALGPPAQICQLTVEDNGIGVESRYLARLFKMFERLHPPQRYPGSGIGLAICRRIAQRHNGSITVQSQPGQGTTFTIKLPVKQRGGDTST
jgi:two-component system sensor kinase FixL